MGLMSLGDYLERGGVFRASGTGSRQSHLNAGVGFVVTGGENVLSPSPPIVAVLVEIGSLPRPQGELAVPKSWPSQIGIDRHVSSRGVGLGKEGGGLGLGENPKELVGPSHRSTGR